MIGIKTSKINSIKPRQNKYIYKPKDKPVNSDIETIKKEGMYSTAEEEINSKKNQLFAGTKESLEAKKKK